MSVPTVLYGSENWVITRTDMSRIQGSEIRLLCSVGGRTRVARIRNEDTGWELNIPSLIEKIGEYPNRYCVV